MTVGRSWRTYAKHDLMRSFVGREVGAANSMRSIYRLVWLDLTAGDAVTDAAWSRNSSPGILAHHALNARKPVDISMFEIKTATHERLLASLAGALPDLGYERVRDDYWRIPDRVTLRVIHGSGHDAHIDLMRHRGDAALVLNDPNAITEWAMRPTFAAEIAGRAWCFRSLSTMGCNPAGLKRLPFEERLKWFELVRQQEDALPPHRDLLLAAIERDDAQWAYLVCDPEKWRVQTEKVVETAFRSVGRTVALSWYRRQPDLFEEQKRTLFFTKPERKELGL